jgi:hypothetical protein
MEMASELVTTLPGNMARAYRRLASRAILNLMAQSDPELAKNMEVEDELNGNKKRPMCNEESEVVKKQRESVLLTELDTQIADNQMKMAENIVRKTAANVQLINMYDVIIGTLPEGPSKAKAQAYIQNHKTNMATRVAENMRLDSTAVKTIKENGEEPVPEAPDAVRNGLPLTIGMILHEKGVIDSPECKISKAIGWIAASLYRAEYGKQPKQSMTLLANHRVCTSTQTNAKTQQNYTVY